MVKKIKNVKVMVLGALLGYVIWDMLVNLAILPKILQGSGMSSTNLFIMVGFVVGGGLLSKFIFK